MGGKQSRVESSEDVYEIDTHAEREGGEVQASIKLTPGLVHQINHPNEQPTKTTGAHQLNADQEAAFKKQLQEAYLKGAEDYRTSLEAQKKQAATANSAKKAQLAKELEAQENARVQQLIEEINSKKYHAPLNDVQCAPERDACLQCYRDKQSDVLQCKEVADAFIRCAQQNTEKFVAEN